MSQVEKIPHARQRVQPQSVEGVVLLVMSMIEDNKTKSMVKEQTQLDPYKG
jgi:hypothetical protein